MKKDKQLGGTESGTAAGTPAEAVPLTDVGAAIARLLGSAEFRPAADRIERVRELERSLVEVMTPKVRGYGRVPQPKPAPPPRRKREPMRLLPPRAMSPADWTAEVVIEWIREAFRTLVALPRVMGPHGFKSGMPATAPDPEAAYGYGEIQVRRALPSADAIDRLDVVLGWKATLHPEDWTLLCRWCRGIPRSELAKSIGRDRRTVHNRVYASALKVVARMRQLQAGRSTAKSISQLSQKTL